MNKTFYAYCQDKVPSFFNTENMYLKEICDGIDEYKSSKKLIMVSIPRKSGKTILSKLLACYLEELNEANDKRCYTVIATPRTINKKEYGKDLKIFKSDARSEIKLSQETLVGVTGCIMDDISSDSFYHNHLECLQNTIDKCNWIINIVFARAHTQFPIVLFETVQDEYALIHNLRKSLYHNTYCIIEE